MLSIIPRPRPAKDTALDVRPLAYALAHMDSTLWEPVADEVIDAARQDALAGILDDLLFEFDEVAA
ncbi:hypothetical protein ACQP25_45335 (plasmid) [Microtetraspora malaysiensis]|uniref:hypothetical protein n=1 Tax=Microtetraspora malaysiensis TaxID=161358 RepID=UPI003D8B80EF